MNIPEFKSDFIDAVNGVLKKHFNNLENVPNKAELSSLLEIVFSVMISLMAIKEKQKHTEVGK